MLRATLMMLFVFLLPALAGEGKDHLKKMNEEREIEIKHSRTLIFEDGFESGHAGSWVGEGNLAPNCNCYFSGDCKSGDYCNWGPAGPFTEDICNWRLPKPNSVPGEGCSQDVPAAGPICDGYCSPANQGSSFGSEDPELVIQALELWATAMLRPAEGGGGPLTSDISQEALNLPFVSPNASRLLGRHVADLLTISGGVQFYHYYCHFEFDDENPAYYANLSDDPCRVEAGFRLVDSLIGEMDAPGSGLPLVEAIADICPGWRDMFTPRCPSGDGALECLKNRIVGYVTFLRTPRRP